MTTEIGEAPVLLRGESFSTGQVVLPAGLQFRQAQVAIADEQVFQGLRGEPCPACTTQAEHSPDSLRHGCTASAFLRLDYASNVKLYPKFQDYFRKSRPPLLAIWGKNDPFFIPKGAEAFRKDIPGAKIQFLDTGHFALETHVVEIASALKNFLETNGIRRHSGDGAATR